MGCRACTKVHFTLPFIGLTIQEFNSSRDMRSSLLQYTQTGSGAHPPPPTQWVQGAPSLGVNLPGYEVDYSFLSSVKVKNKWMCTLLLLHALLAWTGMYLLLPFTMNPLRMGAQMRSHVCWPSSSTAASCQQPL